MAIIKYITEARQTDTDSEEAVIASDWVYEEVGNPNKQGKILTREKALERIKEEGLVLVYQRPYGAVYDHPDEPWWEKWNGKFKLI